MNRSPLLATLTTLTLILLSLPFLQAAGPKTAEEAALAYFEALKADDMEKLTSLMDENDIAKFKEAMAPGMIRAMREPRGRSSISLMMEIEEAEDLNKMSSATFFQKFFRSMIGSTPGFMEALSRSTIKPIGTVKEGPNIHVITRSTMNLDGVEVSKLDIITVVQHGDQFKVLISGEMQNMARLMKHRLEQGS